MALFFILISLSNLTYALYGSRPSVDSRHESVVSFHLSDPNYPEYDYFCSGVVIAKDKILTTGHCMEVMGEDVYEQHNIFQYEPNLIKVKAGGVKYEVSDVIIAPTYSEFVGHEGEDLAIVKLKKALPIKPVKLISKSSLKVGMKATMVARGKVASTQVKSIKTYGETTVVFTDGSKTGICAGDSGGALFIENGGELLLAGILSADSQACGPRTGTTIFPKSSL